MVQSLYAPALCTLSLVRRAKRMNLHASRVMITSLHVHLPRASEHGLAATQPAVPNSLQCLSWPSITLSCKRPSQAPLYKQPVQYDTVMDPRSCTIMQSLYPESRCCRDLPRMTHNEERKCNESCRDQLRPLQLPCSAAQEWSSRLDPCTWPIAPCLSGQHPGAELGLDMTLRLNSFTGWGCT